MTQGKSTKHWRPTLAAITEDGVAREKVHMILMVWRMIRFLITLLITSFETLIKIVTVISLSKSYNLSLPISVPPLVYLLKELPPIPIIFTLRF
ncbi:hypothetical protein Ccrd_015109 [Cynara cardunculus var. scolymus]|uniref:Transmembrane protein n=1 Tax=Cynara cardunculus var. scolymus TaxID=59895 RepID=A0A124SGI8_CYNCS|nr:hypothetical protein Ccrd_015109 [Cynara cardunculus var. scolymus]